MGRFARVLTAVMCAISLSACQQAPVKPTDPQKALMTAVINDNAAAIQRSLANGAQPNRPAAFRGWTPLIFAASGGHGKAVKALVAAGADVNTQASGDGATALMRAAQHGDADICRFLLEQGALINLQDKELHASALEHGAFGGHLEVLRVLVKDGAKVNLRDRFGTTALWLASAKAGPKAVKLLLDHGADPNIGSFYGVTPLMEAAGRGDVAIVKLLLSRGAVIYRKDVNGWAAINHARDAKKKTNGHAEVVRLLREQGADDNGANRHIDDELLEAALRGRLQRVRQLVAKGADVNARTVRGFSVLMEASGHPKTAAYLIGQGADPLALNRGKASVLHSAAAAGNLDLVKRLLALGAPVDGLNNNKETPLTMATETGHLAVARVLLEHGADPNNRSRFGTPLMLAIERNNAAMVKLLKKWDAH